MRAQDYLDSLPGSENRGVNKFLKGLGNVSLSNLTKNLSNQRRACLEGHSVSALCIKSKIFRYFVYME